MASPPTEEKAKQSALSYLRAWGESPVPPTILATLITSLHARPLQPLPLSFPPVLLASTFLNLYSYTTDSAGITAAWSGLYLLLARRRKPEHMMQKFGTRGIVRGTTMGVCGINVLAGGWVYATGKKADEGESAR
ncbi:MAG: hypothetical protein L6R38_007178 [Xanthoria sp. 2 TBL-2021]|nr:MAG: hypothetical protein L6R38_007178 [Xanthoria sp. 2 TBL-2021]